MSKKNGNKAVITQEFHFPQPKEHLSFSKMMYNKDDGTYFGRTIASWSKIGLFYIIFYIVLAGMFSICMQGLFSTLNNLEPKWKLDESLIGSNPGLGFRPLSNITERGSIIKFDIRKNESIYYTNMLDTFLNQYNSTGKKEKFCSFNQTHNSSEVCVVDIKTFGPCSPPTYGYENGRPCVFLKLNKIYNWVPEFYDDPKDLPDDMPLELKQHIANTTELERQQIWVSCDGRHAVDKENVFEINYYPQRGFPAFYYPYTNQAGYLSPLIAVKFQNMTMDNLLNIECRAWAKNIVYSGSNRDRKGSVSFELFVISSDKKAANNHKNNNNNNKKAANNHKNNNNNNSTI